MTQALAMELARLEAQLHCPAVRADAERLHRLLHAEFEEIGRSGDFHSRQATLAALQVEAPLPEMQADGYVATQLGPGSALLTYRSAWRQPDGSLSRHTLRSSIWLFAAGRWQLRFHQGTPAAHAW